jgi:hypothetical protein
MSCGRPRSTSREPGRSWRRSASSRRRSAASPKSSASTYESRKEEGEDPFQRGINSIQLFWDGTRWWVVNIAWDQERDDNEIPDKYLN